MELFATSPKGCRRRLDGLCHRLCPDPDRLELQSIPLLPFFTAHQPAPVQETAVVAAARAAHLAAHTSTGGSSRVVAVQPVPNVWGQPAGSVLDTPEVWAAKNEHYRAHSATAAANGVVSNLAPPPVISWGVPQPVQDTPEVAAARAAPIP
ncbi:hypothetical protein DAPPUDRAFT_272839 [Daphnia pulex]|uniref:Uncharacterized protein n=1 Tax=Daphnia pulex TaxID=6669 RepID=E9I390_DAPPU|nr:hypothetical protein DAPPUDRAFT_272839 [Daphnia pulex]|eukprot:EFX61539.1 hypothetical protein DAPPUDRAFT_272839 [Daphnia pulex]